MAKIYLRNYNRLIENLIENGKHDEAIAHCRHILQTFSKYIEAYRLLGKVFLEAKRYDDAVDIFQRVLMCVPDDFVSNVGLSIIADDQGKLDEAIWHMERAFEVQPSNAAIQGELQRLFGRRDGVEPPKIRLTRGALAHMYIQGELYAQAVSEIRAVLSNDPLRMDMQMLLARAYFRMGQKTEATDSCSQLLKRYPYCLDANRILVEILPGTQRAESTQVYRLRVIELDPYAAFAQDSIFNSDKVPDPSVSLEQLEYKGRASPAADTGADWKSDLGIGLGAASATASSSSSEPDWLKRALTAPPPPAQEGSPLSQDQDQIPDFLRQAGWGESSGQFQEGQSVVPDESGVAPAVQADLPDWIKAMAPAAEEISPALPPNAPVAPVLDIPDWMRRLEHGQPPASTSQPQAVINTPAPSTSDSSPASASQPAPTQSPASVPQPSPTQPPLAAPVPSVPASRDPLGGLGKSVQEQDDAMAWLESLAAKHGAKAEELVTDPNARTDVAPDWVDKAMNIAVPPSAAPVPSVEQPPVMPGDLTGVWLRNLESGAEDKLAPQQDQHEIPAEEKSSSDWLSGLSDQDAYSQISNEAAEPVSTTESSDTISYGDLPAWLASLDQEESPAPASPAPADEMPAWLAAEAETPPPVAEATQPEEWHPAETKSSTAPSAAPADEMPAWLASDAEPPPAATPQPQEWNPAESEPQEPQSAGSTLPEAPSVHLEPPVPVKAQTREISIEIEQPLPAKRTLSKVQKQPVKPARKPEAAASVEDAQSEMGHGNIGAAIDVYARLIRKGKALEEIIRDLRDALYRYPVEVPLWQALGDAYMRSNRLQEALDAYTKAEELLR